MITIANVPAATAWLRQEVGRRRLSGIVLERVCGRLMIQDDDLPLRLLTVAALHARVAMRHDFVDAAGEPIEFPRASVRHCFNDPDSCPNVRTL